MVKQTFLRNRESVSFSFLLTNLQVNLNGIYLGTSHNHHYVSGAFIDFITNLLSFIGICVLIIKHKYRMLFFLVGSYLLIIIITGGLFYEHTPATTRLFIILPFIFTSAALGFDYLIEKIFNDFFYPLIITLIIFSILFINFYRFYVLTPSINPKTLEVIKLENLLKNNNLPISEKKLQKAGVSEQIAKVYKLK